MYFVPAQANCRDNVSCCVRFREHVLDFKAGINVPLRHIVFLHRLDMFFGQQLMCLTLSHDFHDFKGHGRVQTMINQIEHDTVSGTDNLTDGAGSALNDMIANMKHGGNIALLGLQKPGNGVNWETIIWNGLNIRGIYGRKVWDTWYKMTTMLEAGLDISAIITHRMNIKDYKKGFDAMISGQSGKVILNWEDLDKLEPQPQDC